MWCMMKEYKTVNESYIQNIETRDRFVKRSRDHAINVFIAQFFIVFTLFASSQLLLFFLTGIIVIHYWLPLPVIYALLKYAKALLEFTNEDRDILCSQYFNNDQQQSPTNEMSEQETENDGITVIPNKWNGHFYLHIGLSESQKKTIAETMLKTKTLTVNYIESLGVSRQNAERLRVEFAEFGILEFDKRGRTKLTKDGEIICKKILK